MNPSPLITAILVDTVSIQPYLFGSNKLRENIGASHIVGESLFKQLMPAALGCDPKSAAMTAWREMSGEVAMTGANPPDWEIAYEGGGNAMLLFRSSELATAFIRKFTALIAVNYPGLRVAIGMVKELAPHRLRQEFPAVLSELHLALAKARHHAHPSNLLPKIGIMDDCPQSNEAATEQEGDKWIGLGTKAKIDAAAASQSQWRTQYPKFAGTQFTFTSEIEKLGQPEDKGYVAIVHIDGNGIGKRFMACKTLPELRDLSIKVSTLANQAMTQTINELVALFAQGSELWEEFDLQGQDGKNRLPLRPLWMGGDDVVFVCEGRLGIYLANRFIQNFCGLMNQDSDAEHVSACAGVAIVKTKYPFYKAYQLAEDLMYWAKKASRGADEQSEEPQKSWLAFMVSSAGFSGSLEEILEDQYHHGNLSLYGGPYCLDRNEPNSINSLFRGIQSFKSWPRNKVMELRDVLVRSEDERRYFMETLKSRGLELPDNPNILADARIGQYMDMIQWFPFHLKPLSICN